LNFKTIIKLVNNPIESKVNSLITENKKSINSIPKKEVVFLSNQRRLSKSKIINLNDDLKFSKKLFKNPDA